MISDALFEATEEIRLGMRMYPEVYSDLKAKIEHVLSEMDDLRKELDTPPKADQ